MEQATIEEIVEKLSIKKASKLNTFLNGMKYQEKRSYSEEEVLRLLLNCPANTEKETIEWFGQFKKK